MFVLLFFGICLGIDLWCMFALILVPLGHPFGIIFLSFWWSDFHLFFRWYFRSFLLTFVQQRFWGIGGCRRPFSTQGRFQNASATQLWSSLELGSHFGHMLMILASVLFDSETILTLFCCYRCALHMQSFIVALGTVNICKFTLRERAHAFKSASGTCNTGKGGQALTHQWILLSLIEPITHATNNGLLRWLAKQHPHS